MTVKGELGVEGISLFQLEGDKEGESVLGAGALVRSYLAFDTRGRSRK